MAPPGGETALNQKVPQILQLSDNRGLYGGTSSGNKRTTNQNAPFQISTNQNEPQILPFLSLQNCIHTTYKNKSSRTRTAKAKAQEEYAEVNREVKKSIKVDKRNYIDSLAEEAEQAAGRGNMKELYDTTRKLSGKYCHPERPVKDKEGNAIIGNEQQLDRWASISRNS